MSEVIPVEAVEAAHKAWREQAALDGSIFEYNLRAALEAAAPHMLAGRPKYGRAQLEKAWDRCANSDTPWINPYRKGDK